MLHSMRDTGPRLCSGLRPCCFLPGLKFSKHSPPPWGADRGAHERQRLHGPYEIESDEEVTETVTVEEEDTEGQAEDPYGVGANVVITGGVRVHLHGAHAVVLPAAAGAAAFRGDDDTRTVMLTDHRHGPRGKLLTVALRNLKPGPVRSFEGDDGMTVPLRWKLYPPPLTRFTARWLLGWADYSTIVPAKPLHRDQQRALEEQQQRQRGGEADEATKAKKPPGLFKRKPQARSGQAGKAARTSGTRGRSWTPESPSRRGRTKDGPTKPTQPVELRSKRRKKSRSPSTEWLEPGRCTLDVGSIVLTTNDQPMPISPQGQPQPNMKPHPPEPSGPSAQVEEAAPKREYAKPKPKKRPRILATDSPENQTEPTKEAQPKQMPADTLPTSPSPDLRSQDPSESALNLAVSSAADGTATDDPSTPPTASAPDANRVSTDPATKPRKSTSKPGLPLWYKRMRRQRAKENVGRPHMEAPKRPTKRREWLLPMDDDDLRPHLNKTRKGSRAEEQHPAAKSSCTEPAKTDPAASSAAYKTAVFAESS